MTGGRSPHRIAVVGAGISGLSAAYDLAGAGADVTVYEAAAAPGGRISATGFAGLPAVDEGADAFLSRVPDAVDLAVELGLGDELVSPRPVGAAIWLDGLQRIPDGLVLGLPGKLAPLARTSALSWRGKARATLDLVLPRTATDADSIGDFVRRRLGDEVHERLVDALVGSIYATDTDHFSLQEVPQLAALARHRSVILAARRQLRSLPTGTGAAARKPVFAVPRSGVAGLVATLADAVRSRGATVRCDAPVGSLIAAGTGWVVDGDDRPFDDIVLAVPARAAATLLSEVAHDAAGTLASADVADVVMVTLHLPAAPWPDHARDLSGYLVPKPVQRTVTAVSFGSQKWAHWQPPVGGHVLRVSVGRDRAPVLHLSDDQILDAVLADLHLHLGVRFQPLDVRITRWPGAFAQYRPHHRAWVERVVTSLPGGIRVVGASYHGIGLPACVRSGRRAAAELLAARTP